MPSAPSPTWKPPGDPLPPRSQLPDSAFAFPQRRREPLVDATHVRNALARFMQVGGVDDDEREQAFVNICAAAPYFGVHVAERDWHDLVHDERPGEPRCSIVPPYVLAALADAEDQRLAAAAHETLVLTAQLALQRRLLAARGTRHLEGERRLVYDAAHGRVLPGQLVRREGEPPCGDASANAAFEHAGQTFAFFERVFGRASIDGRGKPMLSSVHCGSHYDNAFWNGSEMVYGDGDGVVLGDFTRALDVIAHELTHGLTESTANLAYARESGALNEPVSDVFGSLVGQWVRDERAQDADWLIGAGLLVDRQFGRALRSLKAPGTAYDSIFMGGKYPRNRTSISIDGRYNRYSGRSQSLRKRSSSVHDSRLVAQARGDTAHRNRVHRNLPVGVKVVSSMGVEPRRPPSILGDHPHTPRPETRSGATVTTPYSGYTIASSRTGVSRTEVPSMR